LSLWATGVLTIDQALGGCGYPTVIFIASVFVGPRVLVVPNVVGRSRWSRVVHGTFHDTGGEP
jgi:hypothetical protein